jgi:hypothetical protein
MPGKLDEISEAIGALRASVADIQRRMDENRELQDRRHMDNTTALRELAAKLDLHAAAVANMQPAVTALELSWSKLAAWASIGFAGVVVFGWAVEATVKWAVA